MRTKFLFSLLFIYSFNNTVFAQYFERANTFAMYSHGNYISSMAVDKSGNSFIATVIRPCQSCNDFFLIKQGPSGNTLWSIFGTTGGLAFSGALNVTVDKLGNSYVTGYNYGTTFYIGTLTTQSVYFLVKIDSSGNPLWIYDLDADEYSVGADSMGYVYVSNIMLHKTIKLKPNKQIGWINLLYGGKVAIDGKNRCYVTNGTYTVRFSTTGAISYNKNYGGNDIAVNHNGNAFLLKTSSVQKLSTIGDTVWTSNLLGGTRIAVDKNNAIYTINGSGLNISKLNSLGTSVLWIRSTGTGSEFVDLGVDDNKKIYLAGNYDATFPVSICPFQLEGVNGAMFYNNDQTFTAKISQATPVPFQAGIYTGNLWPNYNSYLCKNQLLNIPFSTCLTQGSNFGTENEFRVEISNNGFNSFTDIGSISSAKIPSSVTAGSFYRIRVVSTSPGLKGFQNWSWTTLPYYTVQDNEATVTVSGPVTFCQGDSVKFTAVFQTYTTQVDWYEGENLLSHDTSISVTSSGIYSCLFHNGDCPGYSDTLNVTVKSKPAATITPQGPTTFCAGGSVVLASNTGIGLTYKWKKGGNYITGATLSTYTATVGGTYKVEVTKSNGCSKTSIGVTVTVPCRESSAITEQEIQNLVVYPSPASDMLNIQLPGWNAVAELKIYNTIGKIVMSEKVTLTDEVLEFVVAISDLTGGIHFVSIIGDDKRLSSRFLKK